MGKESKRRLAEMKAAKTPSLGKSMTRYLQMNRKGVLQLLGSVAVVVFAAVMWKSSVTGIKNLINVDSEMLKSVMAGDVPYLFYCHRGGADEGPPAVFADLNARRGTKYGFAMVNCSQTLPSGKTMWERFNLKKEWKPAIFTTAPWSKSKQASPSHMKDAKALSTFADSALAPRATGISSEKELRSFCGFESKKALKSVGDTCIVLVKGNRHAKVHTDMEERLVTMHPQMKFAIVDASKRRMSIEGMKPISPDNFSLKIHALRNSTHYLSMVNPVTWDHVSEFVSTAIATPSFAYDGDAASPVTFTKAGKGKSAFKQRGPFTSSGSGYGSNSESEPKGSSSHRKSDTTTDPPGLDPKESSESFSAEDGDEDAGETREEVAARKLAAERQRREEMEQQARQHYVEADEGGGEDDSDDEGDDADEEEDDEEDEDVIEL